LRAPLTDRIDVLFVLTPRALLLDVAGPAEAFRLSNQHLTHGGVAPRFHLRFAAAQPHIDSSVGLQLTSLEPFPSTFSAPTWVVLVGQPNEALARPDAGTRAAIHWLSHTLSRLLAHAPQHRLVTICGGSLLAAQAGLIGTRRCTTHHEVLGKLRQAAPAAQVVDNRVFVLDGTLASSAGVTAGIDLALHLIALTCGEPNAAAVAQDMVVYLRRSAQDPELSPLLAHRNHLHPAVHRVQDAVCADPARAWSMAALAAIGHVTQRHLLRLFMAHAAVSPLHYLQSIRLERARTTLAGGASVTRAAEVAGFSSDLQLRRAWRQRFEGTPRSARA
jgi:transcriptional regulator GlxA family with amidase domain